MCNCLGFGCGFVGSPDASRFVMMDSSVGLEFGSGKGQWL